MIRSALLSSLAGALLSVAAAPTLRAATPTVQSDAGAIVLKPLTLLKKDDLDFGTLVPSPGGGTATLDPVTGIVTPTGGIVPLPGGTSPAP